MVLTRRSGGAVAEKLNVSPGSNARKQRPILSARQKPYFTIGGKSTFDKTD
jgi:hypothetical protein